MRGVKSAVKVGRGIQQAENTDDGSGVFVFIGLLIALLVIFIAISYWINKQQNK